MSGKGDKGKPYKSLSAATVFIIAAAIFGLLAVFVLLYDVFHRLL